MPRRVLAVAAAAGLVLTVLTGCHADPRVAAYLDGVTITEAQVDSMLSEAEAATQRDNEKNKGNQNVAPEQAPTRSEVVAVLVTEQITKRVLAGKGIPPLSADANQLAQSLGLPPNTSYARAFASVREGVNALIESAGQDFHATDADLRDVYDRGVASGLEGLGSFDQFKNQVLPQLQGFEQEIGARDELANGVAHANVTVNPRYAPLDYPIDRLTNQQTGQSYVAIPLRLAKGPAGNPVIDTPHSATPAATPAG